VPTLYNLRASTVNASRSCEQKINIGMSSPRGWLGITEAIIGVSIDRADRWMILARMG
jgi:hypothetical protein